MKHIYLTILKQIFKMLLLMAIVFLLTMLGVVLIVIGGVYVSVRLGAIAGRDFIKATIQTTRDMYIEVTVKLIELWGSEPSKERDLFESIDDWG